MRNTSASIAVAAALFFLAAGGQRLGPPPVSADVVFDNLDPGDVPAGDYTPAASVTSGPTSTSFRRFAMRFTVIGTDYALDSVTLPIAVEGTPPGPLMRIRVAPGAYFVRLASGSGAMETRTLVVIR